MPNKFYVELGSHRHSVFCNFELLCTCITIESTDLPVSLAKRLPANLLRHNVRESTAISLALLGTQ